MIQSKNGMMLILAIALLTVGYVLLAQGPVDSLMSKSIAPVVLVITYTVVIPASILIGRKKNDKGSGKQNQGV